jgi:hypothetical protein
MMTINMALTWNSMASVGFICGKIIPELIKVNLGMIQLDCNLE